MSVADQTCAEIRVRVRARLAEYTSRESVTVGTADLIALLSRLDKAEAALMPFAHAAKDCGVADDLRDGDVKPADVIWESAVATAITFGHVAHAAEVLLGANAALPPPRSQT